jgi:hypothetical protein
MNLDKTRIQEIVQLHKEVANHLSQSLEKAIRIGQLLSEQKKALEHGKFTPWIDANLPFTDRTARNYMRLYRERNRLKTETVSGLKKAYALLAAPPEENLDCFNAEAWAEIIKNINAEFFLNLKEYQIDPDPGSTYQLFKKHDDGSMTEREQLGWALWVNFHTHLCFWINIAKAKGKENLNPQVRRYLDAAMADKPNWINEPLRICGEKCQFSRHLENHHDNLA